jgi:hypothetical protein
MSFLYLLLAALLFGLGGGLVVLCDRLKDKA